MGLIKGRSAIHPARSSGSNSRIPQFARRRMAKTPVSACHYHKRRTAKYFIKLGFAYYKRSAAS